MDTPLGRNPATDPFSTATLNRDPETLNVYVCIQSKAWSRQGWIQDIGGGAKEVHACARKRWARMHITSAKLIEPGSRVR